MSPPRTCRLKVWHESNQQQTILTLAGDQVWVYYGCFLNVYDPANVINGQPVQTLLNGTHHCLVAQIAYDGAPIVNANGVTESPENSRNAICRSRLRTIQGRRRPISFRKHSICGRVPPILGQDVLLQYPDELMINWGIPRLAARQASTGLRPTHRRSCKPRPFRRGRQYHSMSSHGRRHLRPDPLRGQPEPRGAAHDRPAANRRDGQEFNIILRRLVTRRFIEPPPPRIASREVPAARNKNHARAPQPINWRYIAGTFQVKIPVATAASILPWKKTRWRSSNGVLTRCRRPIAGIRS